MPRWGVASALRSSGNATEGDWDSSDLGAGYPDSEDEPIRPSPAVAEGFADPLRLSVLGLRPYSCGRALLFGRGVTCVTLDGSSFIELLSCIVGGSHDGQGSGTHSERNA